MAHDPARLPAPAPARRALEDMTTEEVIGHRRAHLTAYQSRRLADRYGALVDRIAKAAAALSDRNLADRLVRAVATAYARVLAPKDEYEVARLLTAPEFRQGLEDAFEGDARIALNLAPPMLGQTGPDGRPPKREFGPRILPVLRALATLKRLRGTPLDPFARNPERRAERQLVRDYEADVDRVLQALDDQTAPLAVQLLDLANQVRGYGPVKSAALEEWSRRRAVLLHRLDSREDPPHRLAAE